MNKQRGTAPGFGWAGLALTVWLHAIPVAAGEAVVSDDGRRIQLNEDGTWEQTGGVSYATTGDGTRVRLLADGTWQRLSPAQAVVRPPVSAPPGLSAQSPVSAELELTKVEIVSRKIRRSKTTFSQDVSVFHLSVRNTGDDALRLPDSLIDEFRARSSRGGEWPIVSMDIDSDALAPGESATIRLVADGAPQWFGVKYMEVQLAPGALGNASRLKLQKMMQDVVKRGGD